MVIYIIDASLWDNTQYLLTWVNVVQLRWQAPSRKMLIDTCQYTCNIVLWLTYTMSDMQYVRHAVCQTCSMSDMQYVRHSCVCHRCYVWLPYVWWLPRWNALCLTDWALSASIDTTYSAHLSAMVEYFACETFLSKQQCGNLTAWNLTICILFYLNGKGNT